MPDPTSEEIFEALAEQIRDELGNAVNPLIPGLEVDPLGPTVSPTPPWIDIYPGDPFYEYVAMSNEIEYLVIVRARVSTADSDGGRALLLSMMDPHAATSMALAISSDRTLNGTVEDLAVNPPTGYGLYPAVGVDGALLGCAWQVRVSP